MILHAFRLTEEDARIVRKNAKRFGGQSSFIRSLIRSRYCCRCGTSQKAVSKE